MFVSSLFKYVVAFVMGMSHEIIVVSTINAYLVGKRRNMKRKGVQQITKAPITTAIIVVILKVLSGHSSLWA
jgi:hypothetical protein